MGKKPWEMTTDEARAEGERLRDRLRRADQIAAPLLAAQLSNDNPTARAYARLATERPNRGEVQLQNLLHRLGVEETRDNPDDD